MVSSRARRIGFVFSSLFAMWAFGLSVSPAAWAGPVRYKNDGGAVCPAAMQAPVVVQHSSPLSVFALVAVASCVVGWIANHPAVTRLIPGVATDSWYIATDDVLPPLRVADLSVADLAAAPVDRAHPRGAPDGSCEAHSTSPLPGPRLPGDHRYAASVHSGVR